jgi:DNA-binding response OmpR family regulator
MSKGKVLVVDDEPEIIKGLSIRLRAAGYEVVTAMDGMQATTTAMREKPDVVVLDIGLPAGNGHIVAQRLRENTVTMHVPIIILTARVGDDDYMQALQNGVNKFLTKPFKAEEIMSAIDECLNSSVS